MKHLFFFLFLSFSILQQANAAGGDGGASGGGTSTILCSGKNIPLDAFAIDFSKVPGNENFQKLLMFYTKKLPLFADRLRKITDETYFHWSLITKNCHVQVAKSSPSVPFSAEYGVYYDGLEGIIVEAAYPTDPRLQLVAITHEAVRLSFCGNNDKCTRFITEAILAKFNVPGISKTDLTSFLAESIRTAVNTSWVGSMGDDYTYKLHWMDANEETINLRYILEM